MTTKLTKKAIASVSALIAEAVATDTAFDQHLHENILVPILGHAANCGDITLICQVIGNVTTQNGAVFGKGVASRRLAMLDWLNAFSPIRVSGDNTIGMLKKTAKDYRPFDVEAAAANPFWTLQAEADRRIKAPVPFDGATIETSLTTLNNRLSKAIEEDRVDAAMVETYRSIITELTGTFVRLAAERNVDPAADKKVREATVAAAQARIDKAREPEVDQEVPFDAPAATVA